MAAEAMGSPKAYAKRLISLAQTVGAPNPTKADEQSNVALAVGLFGRSDLQERLMQWMKPKDAEGSAIRAVRLCSLAAVDASLLGSAALLHVTPVFAQATRLPEPDAKAAPAPTPVTSVPIGNAPAAASKPSARHHRAGLVFSKEGAIIEIGPEPTAEQLRLWEDESRKAEAKAADVEKVINSPKFTARIEKAQLRAAEAEKMVNSLEFKAGIAKAVAQAADAEKWVNSAEFKTRIAKAADVEKLVASPEFKERIANAQARAATAQPMINSPEFKERIGRIGREAADRALAEHGRDEPHTDGGQPNPAP